MEPDNGKVALVTGSSRGIGAAIARELGRDGWNILIHYTNNREDAESVAANLGERSLGVIQADLKSEEQTARLWQEALNLGTKVDALVNNAGIYTQSPFGMTLEAWRKERAVMMRVNFEAPSELIYYALEHFQRHGTGKVLNVASRVGFRGEANAAFYAA